MVPMSVTLDVSKLSGWLNFAAPCRESKGGDTMRSGMHGGGLSLGWGPRARAGAHSKHLVHGRDASRVEAERLVERFRFLPGMKAGMRCGKRYRARGA